MFAGSFAAHNSVYNISRGLTLGTQRSVNLAGAAVSAECCHFQQQVLHTDPSLRANMISSRRVSKLPGLKIGAEAAHVVCKIGEAGPRFGSHMLVMVCII